MADVTISYKGSSIATMDASGTKTLETKGKYCEDNIAVVYTDPEKPTQTKSVTPSESAQTVTPDSGKVLSQVNVGAVSPTYVGTGVTRKAAQTYTPGTADQTIPAARYLTGAQTIKGDANLVAGNIKSGVSIFGVAGTHTGGITPTGTKQISITQNGTTTEDVTQYANAEIMVNVPSGASLPSVISKIDGGSFTFATDTAVQTNKISHTLGVKPKGYIIWSDDVMRVADGYQNICLMFSYGIGLPWLGSIGGTENQTGYSYAMWRKTNGAVKEQNSSSPTIDDTQIAPVGFYYWRGGATYKWLAWA